MSGMAFDHSALLSVLALDCVTALLGAHAAAAFAGRRIECQPLCLPYENRPQPLREIAAPASTEPAEPVPSRSALQWCQVGEVPMRVAALVFLEPFNYHDAILAQSGVSPRFD